jgi:hypothetical protein
MRTAACLALVVASCGSLTAEERAAMSKVEVITAEPARECQNLGPVSGSPLQLEAMRLGGNVVRRDASPSSGTAFYCPPPAEPRPPPLIVQP